jgi:dihydroorotase
MKTRRQIELRVPDDFHIHLRQGEALADYASDIAQTFARGIAMPNLVPPIVSPTDVETYASAIRSAAPNFTPLMTFKVLPRIQPSSVAELQAAGAVAGKLYPVGVTTNAEDGVSDPRQVYGLFEAMQESELLLLIHGEKPGTFSLDREAAFVPELRDIVRNFPRLRVVLEHVSSAAAVEAVKELPDTVAATITVHHLYLTLDDVVGGSLQPHHFCKPIAKRPSDRSGLLEAALSGNPKFFFGSDSAPHRREDKECADGCAGIYTAPVAYPLLAELFLEHADERKLEDFTSRFGAEFYGLPLNEGRVRLSERRWRVPLEYHGVVPFRAGAELEWQAERR